MCACEYIYDPLYMHIITVLVAHAIVLYLIVPKVVSVSCFWVGAHLSEQLLVDQPHQCTHTHTHKQSTYYLGIVHNILLRSN